MDDGEYSELRRTEWCVGGVVVVVVYKQAQVWNLLRHCRFMLGNLTDSHELIILVGHHFVSPSIGSYSDKETCMRALKHRCSVASLTAQLGQPHLERQHSHEKLRSS